MKPESRFILRVHRELPAALYCEKMHNIYRGGTADVWYSGPKDMWVEYKWLAALPKRDTTLIVPALEPAQERWLNGRHKEGRNVAVVVGSDAGSIIFRAPFAGIPRADAPLLTTQQIAEWITEQCGLTNSARPRTRQRRSTPSSSSPS